MYSQFMMHGQNIKLVHLVGFIMKETSFVLCFLLGRYVPIRLWRWNWQSVPKHLPIKFRRRGITRKKAHNIQNTAKVWNQDLFRVTVLATGICIWLPDIWSSHGPTD